MNIVRAPSTLPLAASLVLALARMPIAAWAADVFDFIPAGRPHAAGQGPCEPSARLTKCSALLGAKRTREEWLVYLRSHGKAITGLQAPERQGAD